MPKFGWIMVNLKYCALNLMPLMVYPEVLLGSMFIVTSNA